MKKSMLSIQHAEAKIFIYLHLHLSLFTQCVPDHEFSFSSHIQHLTHFSPFKVDSCCSSVIYSWFLSPGLPLHKFIKPQSNALFLPCINHISLGWSGEINVVLYKNDLASYRKKQRCVIQCQCWHGIKYIYYMSISNVCNLILLSEE